MNSDYFSSRVMVIFGVYPASIWVFIFFFIFFFKMDSLLGKSISNDDMFKVFVLYRFQGQ